MTIALYAVAGIWVYAFLVLFALTASVFKIASDEPLDAFGVKFTAGLSAVLATIYAALAAALLALAHWW